MQMQTPRKHLRVLLHFVADVEMSLGVALSQKRLHLWSACQTSKDDSGFQDVKHLWTKLNSVYVVQV